MQKSVKASWIQEWINATVCQLQVKELEEQLENQALQKEISRLKQQLELLEEDKKELELKCQNSEEKARDLKHTGNEFTSRSIIEWIIYI